MKTRLKIILPASIILIALVGVAIAALALPRSLAPEQEERISYDKDQQVALIDSQLAGIDLEKVRAKKDLIMEKSIEGPARGDLQGRLDLRRTDGVLPESHQNIRCR